MAKKAYITYLDGIRRLKQSKSNYRLYRPGMSGYVTKHGGDWIIFVDNDQNGLLHSVNTKLSDEDINAKDWKLEKIEEKGLN